MAWTSRRSSAGGQVGRPSNSPRRPRFLLERMASHAARAGHRSPAGAVWAAVRTAGRSGRRRAARAPPSQQRHQGPLPITTPPRPPDFLVSGTFPCRPVEQAQYTERLAACSQGLEVIDPAVPGYEKRAAEVRKQETPAGRWPSRSFGLPAALSLECSQVLVLSCGRFSTEMGSWRSKARWRASGWSACRRRPIKCCRPLATRLWSL